MTAYRLLSGLVEYTASAAWRVGRVREVHLDPNRKPGIGRVSYDIEPAHVHADGHVTFGVFACVTVRASRVRACRKTNASDGLIDHDAMCCCFPCACSRNPLPAQPTYTCDCGQPIDPTTGVSMCRECFDSCEPATEDMR